MDQTLACFMLMDSKINHRWFHEINFFRIDC